MRNSLPEKEWFFECLLDPKRDLQWRFHHAVLIISAVRIDVYYLLVVFQKASLISKSYYNLDSSD
jgi:hypothetical protein